MILPVLSELDVLKVPPTLECAVILFPGGRREIQTNTSKQSTLLSFNALHAPRVTLKAGRRIKTNPLLLSS